MIDTTMLPAEGETLILPDDTLAKVAWCSGWTWPLTEPVPTRLYAQAERAGEVLPIELRVIAARDAAGTRFWIAERRA